ncbi:piriformospora indica-insensitive protein 2 [Selaginella moellendorffii]|nr:piriformospora indica-insensitive protein 2 [Selaginella moellendorffii]|eukprot:XP_002973336.2 piriformospora indica-insensitive protein 2 [Selaginella moellendorffii]
MPASPISCAAAISFLVWMWIIVAISGQQDEQSMDPAEKEAFFQVMESLNSEWDWRSLLPDPCGENTLQGMICDVVDDANSSFPNSIHLVGLSVGKIQSNTPSCSANATIHPSIAKLSHLKSLAFYGCFTKSPAMIPASIAAIATLSTLTFQNNPALQGPIPAELANLRNLERLILVGNGLAGEIPAELGDLTSLQQLVISQNPGILGALPRTLKFLSSLVILDLSHNALDSIANLSLAGLDRLRKLDLSNNRINATLGSLESLPPGLELLDLSHNLLRGGREGNFLEPLLGLATLRELYLHSNPIQGAIPSIGWERLGASLISLDISDSQLRGAIPSNLGALPSLRFLGLARNELTGAIPRELARLDQLAEINLSENSLAGPVPFSIDSITRFGSKLKLGNNTGLCYPPQILSMIQQSSSSSLSSQGMLDPCDKSTLPVAFQVGNYAPSPSSSIIARGSSTFGVIIAATFATFFVHSH